VSIVVVALIGIVSGAVYFTKSKSESVADTQESSVSSSETGSSASAAEDSSTEATATDEISTAYTAGSYTATGSYSTPGGSESVTVTATLAGDGVITAVSAEGSATRGNSAQYQSNFLSAFKSLVVGKSIDSVSLSRVSGSSLTSAGFNKALATIKNEARV
jgi:hypothetical protein